MLTTQIVLILIALLSAVVGTMWNARPWGKVLIIALAAATAGTAIYGSLENTRAASDAKADAMAARQSLDLLVRAIQPPAIFDEAVLGAFRKTAEERNLFVSGQSISEDGSRIFEFRNSEGEQELAGVVHLGTAVRQDLFVAFAQDEDLVMRTSSILFDKWGKDDLSDDWNIFALTTYEIGRHALTDTIPLDLEYTGNFDPEEQEVSIQAGDLGTIHYSAGFMNALLAFPPLVRGKLIYVHAVDQAMRWQE